MYPFVTQQPRWSCGVEAGMQTRCERLSYSASIGAQRGQFAFERAAHALRWSAALSALTRALTWPTVWIP
jgi:hypothetical protein